MRGCSCVPTQAWERGEQIVHPEPSLAIVVTGTAVLGGRPIAIGQCWGTDVILASDALRDTRPASALTYCEICCLTRAALWGACQQLSQEQH